MSSVVSGHERLISGQAWRDFCDQLKNAGSVIDQFDDENLSDQDRVEWFRFMTRLARNGFERFVENCEEDRPRLRDTPWRQSINFQSPDQDHLLTEFVDGSHDYVIKGNRGGLPYLVLASWTAPQPKTMGDQDWAPLGLGGLNDFDPSDLGTTGFLTSDQIDFDTDGNFEIIVSQNNPGEGKNWLPITDDCVGLLVRTLFLDRKNTVPPVCTIARLDDPSPRPMRPVEMSNALAKSGQVVLGYAELVRRWWQENLNTLPNRIRFSQELYLSNGGVPDRHHGFGTWDCGKDEALVMDFIPMETQYWIFQLCSIWQENLDNYEDGGGHITKQRHKANEDGSVRIIIAHEDPALPGNFINTFCHHHGGMSLRFIGLKEGRDPPDVTIRKLSLSDLKERGEAAIEETEKIVSGEIMS